MRREQKSQASTEIDRLAEYLMVNFQSEIGKSNRREEKGRRKCRRCRS